MRRSFRVLLLFPIALVSALLLCGTGAAQTYPQTYPVPSSTPLTGTSGLPSANSVPARPDQSGAQTYPPVPSTLPGSVPAGAVPGGSTQPLPSGVQLGPRPALGAGASGPLPLAVPPTVQGLPQLPPQNGQPPAQAGGPQLPGQAGQLPLPAQLGPSQAAPLQPGAPQAQAEPTKAEAKTEAPAELPADFSPVEKAIGAEPVLIDDASPQSYAPPRLRQFGYDFFKTTGNFVPSLDAPVSLDYLVGPGDHVLLNVWGSIEGAYDLEVNRTGEVVLPRVGAVKVWGTPFRGLQELFRSRLARVFKDFELNVNVGKLRLIKVFVVGEVASPGSYEVSSLATALYALAQAGGPSKTGSLRSIQVKRGETVVQTLDLYDFFLQGDRSKDIRLQSGDTVFVPVIGPTAGISGNVLRPAIYELKPGDNLAELLRLAGGLIPTGYLQRVRLARVEAYQKRVVTDFNLGPQASEKNLGSVAAGIVLQNMDLVTIRPIDQLLRGYVRLKGHVVHPGDFALKPGLRLTDLVQPAELLPEYRADAVEVTRRLGADLHPETVYVNLGKALAGDPSQNLELREFDTVRVFSRWDLEEVPQVKVSGEVQAPNTFRLFTGMRIRDALLRAGGLKSTASLKKAELVRVRRNGQVREAYRIPVDLDEVLRGNADQNLLLERDDELIVRQAPLVPQQVFPVTVSGQVLRPGRYQLYEKMTVADLLNEAGGPVPMKAFLQNAEINRISVDGGSVRSFPIVVDLEKALRGDRAQNVALEPYDELVVRTLPDWLEETERYVTLKGEVRFPGSYPIFKGERLSSVLERAGGFTPKAYLRAAKFTRKSVQEDQQKRMEEIIKRTEDDIAQKQADAASAAASAEELQATKAALDALTRSLNRLKSARAEGRVVIRLAQVDKLKGGPYDVELQAGDALEVPQSSSAVSVLGEVYNPTTLLTTPDHDVQYYLARAGGPTQQAEQDEIYVIRADGSLFSRQQKTFDGSAPNWFSGRWFGDSFLAQKLEAGDTVVVPRQLEKIAWMREIKDITQIISQIAVTAGVVIAAGL